MGAPNRKTIPLCITLPKDQHEMVKKLVSSGGYASDSEVIREGLRVLQAREAAMEKWLRSEVIPAYLALKKEPTLGMSIDQVRAGLAKKHK